ncbi:MAG: molybdenum cofactor biosynthesis protein MoaE [Luteitalea sp.]|nr:molybdenum cofactor biosynthesis protein MoaE [Luteitalea sp.]
MAVSRFTITREPLILRALVEAVLEAHHDDARATGRPSPGAAASFVGLVRNENAGRRVLYLEYEAYEPLALAVFERITNEVNKRWPEVVLGIHHRIGRLDVGQPSVAIVASSPHRAEASGACRYVIERVKQIAPIWKREVFDGGETWIEGAVADPEDEAAAAEAWRRACA